MTERRIVELDVTKINNEALEQIRILFGVPQDSIITKITMNPDVVLVKPFIVKNTMQSEICEFYKKCDYDVSIRIIAKNP